MRSPGVKECLQEGQRFRRRCDAREGLGEVHWAGDAEGTADLTATGQESRGLALGRSGTPGNRSRRRSLLQDVCAERP